MFKMRTKQKETPDLPDFNGDACTQYYHGEEMGKVTDAERDEAVADDEWSPVSSTASKKDEESRDEIDALMDEFFASGSDQSDFFFNDPTDEAFIRESGLKC